MRPVWAEVNLSSIAHNFQEIRRVIPKPTKVMAIVKANAYGHGAVPVARKILEAGADYLGVALLAEAIELRENGINAPLLILGYTPEEEYPTVIKKAITQTIFSYKQAKVLSKIAEAINVPAKVHIKIDTGMGRIGFKPVHETIREIKAISRLPLEIEGLFTHLAKADAKDKTFSRLQLERFLWVCQEVLKAGVTVKLRHIANSAGIIDMPETHLDLVRPGIMLYGLYPSKEVNKEKVKLQPAMSLKTRIVHLKEVEAGTGIGYGCTYVTRGPALIATLPIGYADGYSRLLSNKGMALVRSRKVPLVGRICMDQCMLDVSGVEAVVTGDEAVLFGQQGNTVISIDEVAARAQTIIHEIVCKVSNRVPRIYI